MIVFLLSLFFSGPRDQVLYEKIQNDLLSIKKYLEFLGADKHSCESLGKKPIKDPWGRSYYCRLEKDQIFFGTLGRDGVIGGLGLDEDKSLSIKNNK